MTTTIPRGIVALHAAALATFPAILVLAQPAARAELGELRAWHELEQGPAEARTANHRLIGFACGPDRLTMTAAEEDHFPTCEAIEPIAAVCPPYEDGQPTAVECARYMGDGW